MACYHIKPVTGILGTLCNPRSRLIGRLLIVLYDRLETNVDLLKAEMQSMQRAMQRSSPPRQSVRLASIQSHQQHLQAAVGVSHTPSSSRDGMSQMGAATPERELEAGGGSKRYCLNSTALSSNFSRSQPLHNLVDALHKLQM